MSFSESAKLSIRELKEWADEEARSASVHVDLAGEAMEQDGKGYHHVMAATHQRRARWLFETLAEATVDREKT